MVKALRMYGLNPSTRIPHRFSEGYGLSEKIIDEISDGLIITVDNGIAAIDAIKKAKEKGLYVITLIITCCKKKMEILYYRERQTS